MLPKFSLILPDLLLLFVLYFFCFRKRWRRLGTSAYFYRSLLYLYFACVLLFTLMPILKMLPQVGKHPYNGMNLIPFLDYKMGRRYAEQELFCNVLMLIPFGVLLPLVTRRRFFGTVFSSFLLSLSIELLQPLLHGANRTSDVTDLITNTLGGFLGYLLYLILLPLTRRLTRALDRKRT